jgi:hypothetical protein
MKRITSLAARASVVIAASAITVGGLAVGSASAATTTVASPNASWIQATGISDEGTCEKVGIDGLYDGYWVGYQCYYDDTYGWTLAVTDGQD